MHAIIRTAAVIAFLGALAGCVTDISRDPRYGTDYVVAAVYRVKKPLFADRGAGTIFGTYDDPLLELVGTQRGGLPANIQEYEQAPRHWRNIAGIVSPGDKLKVTKIKLERNPEMGRMIWVEAQILNGALAGTKHAELFFISSSRRSEQFVVDVPMVDSNILERVAGP
jgi:hypothetical protein